MKVFYACLVALLGIITQVHSHGMVIDPPNRSSMWRFGYHYPPNYDDDGNYCGGLSEMWDDNNGKCGICGDEYSLRRPRPNEHGGRYGLGVIPDEGRYVQGQIITVRVVMTTTHLGHFQFSLCKMESPLSESEDCFDQHPLKFADGSSKLVLSSNDESKNYTVQLQLPKDLSCDHCVLRWHYRAGNNWGECGLGIEGMGCGPQETFRTCSDISISPVVRKIDRNSYFQKKWLQLSRDQRH